MITRFEVENYKSIKKLSLDMKPFMVLVGPNGSGKTNVVQALALLGSILSRGTSAPVAEQGWDQVIHRAKKPARGGLRLAATAPFVMPPAPGSTAGPETFTIRVSVVLVRTSRDPEVLIEEEEISLTSERSELRVVRRSGENATYDLGTDPWLWTALCRFGPFKLEQRGDVMKRADAVKEIEKQLQKPPIPVAFGASTTALHFLTNFGLTHLVAQGVRTARLRLDTSGLRSEQRVGSSSVSLQPSGQGLAAMVDRLRRQPKSPWRSILEGLRAVYPRIEDVTPETFGGGRVTLSFTESGITQPIPLDGISDGVLHALAILVALEVGANGRLVVEEPENAIHPWALRKLVDRCQSDPRKQEVLLTTHSETVVNAIQRPESLFIVERDDRKGTTVTPALTKERALDAILRESGQRLGDVWLGGSLGGVPQ